MKFAKLFLYLLIISSFSGNLNAANPFHRPSPSPSPSPSPYLLPQSDPLHEQLSHLLTDPHMFQSTRHLKNAGFSVQSGNIHTRLMLGSHPLIPNYLLKKFPDHISQSKQLKNFIDRIQGAEVIRRCIEKHQFKYLTVPKKWLYKLPKKFPYRSYVLVVEKVEIEGVGNDPNGKLKELYYNMDVEVLTELCILLHDVGGCDSHPRNMPFTTSGQIAFVDTEEVGTPRTSDKFLRNTLPALNEDLQAYAKALWEKLEYEKNVNQP